jgi:3-dehydro-L-gulonate 2-dehydrogenase
MLMLSPEEIGDKILPILIRKGFGEDGARTIADVFIENNLEGVDSHGLARFPGFIESIDAGRVKTTDGPERVASFGAWEQWDGLCGAGPLNARAAMNRAMEIAQESAVGCVALRRTNHWMRGGTYGKQAADAGMIGICWTNTMPNMIPWGGNSPTLGNNPLVLAAPLDGAPVVMDMAMTQFSYGKLEQHRLHRTQLPVAGGWDTEGKLTRDPDEILETGKLLPAGYWKGTGLAFVLDLLASLLASGNSTSDIAKLSGEQQISQVFLAFDVARSGSGEEIATRISAAIDWMKGDEPESVRYPGQRAAEARLERLAHGIPIPEATWNALG